MNSVSLTWDQFSKQIQALPEDMRNKAIPEIREGLYRISKPLEVLAEAAAYTPAPGTKPSKGNTRSRWRQYGLRLAPTISRFKNQKNPLKAYVVTGNLAVFRGGAFYAPMQLGGYRPGRPSIGAKVFARELYGRTKNGGTTAAGREFLARSRRTIPGKNYLYKAFLAYGNAAQQSSLKLANSIVTKYLQKI